MLITFGVNSAFENKLLCRRHLPLIRDVLKSQDQMISDKLGTYEYFVVFINFVLVIDDHLIFCFYHWKVYS